MSQSGIPLARVGGSRTLEELEALSVTQADAAKTRAAEEAAAIAKAAADAKAAAADLVRQEAEAAADEAPPAPQPAASSFVDED